MVDNAVRGIVASLDDPYAAYFTASEYEQYLSRIHGSYNGIGLLISQTGEHGVVVLEVYEGCSAEEAGILVGDIITHVDGVSIVSMQMEEIAAAINTELGDYVNLTILRGEETLEFEVQSRAVDIVRVHGALFKERTGYIRIDMFTGNCVSEFSAAVKDLQARGMKSLVIDLRNNPGGSLDDVVSIADEVLGSCTVVTVKGNDGEEQVYKSTGKALGIPIAVIVNEHSASASEILASAIQDNGAGVVVGMTTFGKGIVQTTSMLESNNGWLKLTTHAYFTPNGNSIHGVGVKPDLEVDLPDALKGLAIPDIAQDDDAQLWAALDYVREKVNNPNAG
jgi:carboxyl-terminal processing protease